MGAIKGSAMEALVWVDSFGNLHPLLAESWTVHNRPDEISSLGENQGGVAAIEFKLQEGVTFQDGSAFNASVVKWNYDRALQISGYDDPQWMATYWMNPATYRPRFTTSWDLTWGINDPEVSFIDTANWATINDGDHITYTSKTVAGVQDYYIYFDTTGANSTDPAPSGRMPIYCNISASTLQENVSKVLGTAYLQHIQTTMLQSQMHLMETLQILQTLILVLQ
ncbi:MAG: ABC transporter substrate-binding protein [Candidatus Heimdallarchaeota archaeon]